jgi:hypothetical protein
MLVRTAAAGAQGAVKVGKPEVAASAAALPCVSSVPAAFRVMVVPVGSFRPGLVFCTYSLLFLQAHWAHDFSGGTWP